MGNWEANVLVKEPDNATPSTCRLKNKQWDMYDSVHQSKFLLPKLIADLDCLPPSCFLPLAPYYFLLEAYVNFSFLGHDNSRKSENARSSRGIPRGFRMS